MGANGDEVYEQLAPHAEMLSRITGAQLQDGSKDHFFALRREADTSNETHWDELADWLYDKTRLYERALQEIVE
jgi:hypothetical protein